MSTTLPQKSTVLSITCQERPRISASLFAKSVYQFFTNRNLKPFNRQSASAQINQSNLHLITNANPFRIETVGMQSFEETPAKILDCSVGFPIPSRDFRGQKINNEKMIIETKELFTRLFRGCIVSQVKGHYLSECDQIIAENITLVKSYASRVGFDEHLKEVRATVLGFKKDYRQESVALIINNRMYLF